MNVRRVDIENFRGIKHLSWRLPKERSFITLIGPGDSAKSSILTAIDMALSDRWNLAISDTDFYMGNVDYPILIRVTLGDLPAEIRTHDVLGMCLCGIDDEGEVFEDPEDEYESCVVIALTVDKELEPAWTAHRPGKATPEIAISSSVRRLIGSFKVDERIDAHLRWSRMSALGRLTDSKHGTNELLAGASRAAREAVEESIPKELAELTTIVQDQLHKLGSGEFRNLRPGLDQSLSSSTGNLALYEGPVPLTNYGLGSRRLAGVATQQLAHPGKGVMLVDEVEYGLEPHRLVNLLGQLRMSSNFALAVATTHSPLALEHLDITQLGVVRRTSEGGVTVRSFEANEGQLQGVLRAAPAAFLARRVVVCEGKTELGMCLQLVENWDQVRSSAGEAVSAGLGVVAVDGDSGSKATSRASELNKVGYEVVLFLDSDVEVDRVAADALVASGGTVVRWQDGFNTERAVCEVLDANGLTALIEKAITLQSDSSSAKGNFIAQLASQGLPKSINTLDVTQWNAAGTSLASAREFVAKAAHRSGWFKQVDSGKELAKIMLDGDLDDSDVGDKIAALRSAIYTFDDPEVQPQSVGPEADSE